MIAIAHVAEHGLELRSIRVFAAGLVGEGFFKLQAFELARVILVGAGDAHIADPLAGGGFFRWCHGL
ncbi:hypothetical protein FQZ97_1159370 [compost metagenome]